MATATSAKPTKLGRMIYHFGGIKADGSAALKSLLGGKGANLAEMARRGFNVPHGFTITTEVCTYFYANKRTYPKSLFGPRLFHDGTVRSGADERGGARWLARSGSTTSARATRTRRTSSAARARTSPR